MQNKANDTYSLSHTSWKCQYHIVFAPKYRRKAIYGKLKAEIGAILRELCERKHVNIIEAHAMPDHIHEKMRCFISLSHSAEPPYILKVTANLIKEYFSLLGWYITFSLTLLSLITCDIYGELIAN